MKPLLTLHDPAAARAYYAAGLWCEDTLYGLLARHAAARPADYALRDSTRRLTWEELKDWTDGCAAALAAAGVDKGERVSLLLSNRVEAVIAFLACARQGYVCNPSLHRNYTVAEILTLLERLNASALFAEERWGADAEHKDLFAPATALASMRRVFRLPASRQPGEFPAPGDAGPADGNPDRVVYLAFTSGTTGMPKGVMHSDNTLLANARAMVRDWRHDERSVLLSLSPLSHHIAWVGVAQCLVAGMEMVVNDPPRGMSPLDWMVETGATYVMGVPTHAMDMLAEQKRRGIERLGRVTSFYMAGSPIPPATARAFLDQSIKPQNVYGMTECSSHQYTLPSDDIATIVNTCGCNRAHYEVRLFRQDNRDEEVAPGEVGEIGGKGACLMLGYFGNQRATEASFNRDGWFMSGDLGRFDANACLEIVGRLKDIVIRGGHNIHPARIEYLAVKHAGVQKAAAFGVPDERLGERVCLAVIPVGADPSADEMLAHLFRVGLSRFDMPEWFIALPEFPLTASGKILKRELAAMVRDGRIQPQPCRWHES
jgi:acyl-CoA synthetase